MARQYRTLLAACLGIIWAAAGEASLKETKSIIDCRAEDISRIVGIGLDLAASYAVAAIRNPDGSIDNLMKINADKEYKAVMARVADPSSASPCWNPKCISERSQCWMLRRQKHWNKLRGLPPTPEIGTVANFLIEIDKAIYAELGPVDFTRFLPVLPALPGFSQEDLADAMEYAGFGLSNARVHSESGGGTDINAAFAGMGRGLCKDHCQQKECQVEESSKPWSFVLSVTFDNAALRVSHSAIRSAYLSVGTEHKTDFELGSRHIPKSEEDQRLFWQRIHNMVVTVGSHAGDISDVLIRGETASEPKFTDTIRHAISELFPDQPDKLERLFADSSHPGRDPLFVAARGAAELDKRAQDVYRGIDGANDGRLCKQSSASIIDVFNAEDQIVLGYLD